MINLPMNSICQTIVFLIFFISLAFSQTLQYEEQDTFFNELELQIIEDFKKCTNDTTVPELKYLLEWKDRIHLQTKTKEYQEILKEYMAVTGILDNIMPCQVLAWHKSRINFLDHHESKAAKQVIGNSDRIVDSIGYLNEKLRNPSSKFDFEEIPFGFSKKYFLKKYNEKFGNSPVAYDTIFITEHYLYKDTPFILRFYFDENQRFYAYDIESYSYSGNDLNSKVRVASDLIKEKMIKNIGKPNVLNRIGFFDIKTNKPTLYAKWYQKSIKANLYFAIRDERYFTILKVTKNLEPKK